MPRIEYAFDQRTGAISVNNTGMQAPSSVTLYSTKACVQVEGEVDLLHTHWEAAPLGVPAIGWNARLSQPQQPCAEGAFVSLSYKGPVEGYDPFEISTPIFLRRARG